MANTALRTERQIISELRFARHGARVLARRGYPIIAAQYRTACRHRIAELRAARSEG